MVRKRGFLNKMYIYTMYIYSIKAQKRAKSEIMPFNPTVVLRLFYGSPTVLIGN